MFEFEGEGGQRKRRPICISRNLYPKPRGRIIIEPEEKCCIVVARGEASSNWFFFFSFFFRVTEIFIFIVLDFRLTLGTEERGRERDR